MSRLILMERMYYCFMFNEKYVCYQGTLMLFSNARDERKIIFYEFRKKFRNMMLYIR